MVHAARVPRPSRFQSVDVVSRKPTLREPTRNQQPLAEGAISSFGLNGEFLRFTEALARPVGLTTARWRVLGTAFTAPLTVWAIARNMVLSRQAHRPHRTNRQHRATGQEYFRAESAPEQPR